MINKHRAEHLEKDLLSSSYDEGVGRISGVKNSIAYGIPPEILENRKKFWNELFHKYTEQESDETELYIDTFTPYTKGPRHKSFYLIEYWVNTGYFPYNKQEFNMDKDMQSETVLSLSEECSTLSSHHLIEKKDSQQYAKLTCNDKSSSSSVDTTAYILSNMNTTNKAETMAIVEGAKNSPIVNSQDTHNVGVTQMSTDKKYANDNEDIVVRSSSNEDDHHFLVSSESSKCKWQEIDADIEENAMHLSKTADVCINQSTMPKTCNTNNEVIDNCKAYYMAPSSKTPATNENQSISPYIQKRLCNTSLSQIEQNYFMQESRLLQDSMTKSKHRKKLYTGRDSPVDLLKMKNSNKFTIPKLKQNLHPAFDLGYKVPKKYKMFKKRQTNNLNMSNNCLINTSQFSILNYSKRKRRRKKKTFNITCNMNDSTKLDDTLSKNGSFIKNSIIEKSVIDHNELENLNTKTLVMTTKSKLSRSIDHVEKNNKNVHKRPSIITKQLKTLNPIVYLKRLSKVDIQKLKRPKRVSSDSKNLSVSQLLEVNCVKHRALNNVMHLKNRNSVACLACLSDSKKIDQMLGEHENLYPVVCLKQLSELEIQAYKNVSNTAKNLGNLNPIVRLERLSNTDIQKYKIDSRREIENRSALLNIVSLQKDDLSNSHSLDASVSSCSNSPKNIINLMFEDTASDQSTLLMYKCDPTISTDNCSVSEFSTSSINSLQTCIAPMQSCDNTSKKILEFHEKKIELENKSRKREKNIMENRTPKKRMTKVSVSTSPSYNNNRYSMKRTNSNCRKSPRNRTIKNVNNVNESSKVNAKNFVINENVFGNIYQNDITSSSDMTEIISENRCSTTNVNISKQKAPTLLLSDEDDEFVKLVYCPQDVQESKLRQRYKMLNQNFNSGQEGTKSDRSTGIKNNMQYLRKNGRRSKCNEVYTKSGTESCKFHKQAGSFSPIKVSKLAHSNYSSGDECSNKVLCNEQTALERDRKLVPNVGSLKGRSKSSVSHLCFKTKIFDSDSESLTI